MVNYIKGCVFMNYNDDRTFKQVEVKKLYESNNWISYYNHMERTMLALEKAFYVYSCWNDNELVGLVRCVGDGITILYIQDLLVLPKYQGQGIGAKLLKDTLEKFKSVYQVVLITDENDKTESFYKKIGLSSGKDKGIVPFIKMNY